MCNAPVLEAIADAAFQTELGQFNVEINIPPRLLGGRRVLASSSTKSGVASTRPRSALAASGAHMMLIGILPTIDEAHLNADAFSREPALQTAQRADLRRPR